jgi:hypothetical protein
MKNCISFTSTTEVCWATNLTLLVSWKSVNWFKSFGGGGFNYVNRHHAVTKPPSLLLSGYQGLFPWWYGDWGMKLTTHLQLVWRSRMVELYLHSPIR